MTIAFEDFLSVLPQASKAGDKILGVCPFHDDRSPSLLVFRDGWWRCLGCGKSNKWEVLWNKLHGQNVQVQHERTMWTSPRIETENMEDVCFQAHEDLLNFTSFKWYLEMRGLDKRIETAELGYWYGWYTIPVRDYEGKFKTAVFRAAPHIQEVTGQRYWIKGAPQIYVPDWHLLDKNNYLFVVFGMFDALALNELRLPVVTSTSGNTTFKPEWLDNYRKRIYIIPDMKEEKAAIKLAAGLGWRGNPFYLDYPADHKDPADFFKSGKEELLRKQLLKIGNN